MQGSLQLCFERGRDEERQGQPWKTGAAASLAAEEQQTGWKLHILGQGRTSLLPYQQLFYLNGSGSSQLLFPSKVSSKPTDNLSSFTSLGLLCLHIGLNRRKTPPEITMVLLHI